jgi:hypothetical protein
MPRLCCVSPSTLSVQDSIQLNCRCFLPFGTRMLVTMEVA